jgi:2-iminobutanoate/2-iminopropanoate deaminase
MSKEYINPEGLFTPGDPPIYSHAVKAGNTIYVSGKTARDEKGDIIKGGLEEQTIKAFENLKVTLEAAGASLQDIVKLTVYLTNMDEIEIFRRTRSRYLSRPLPASTVIGIASLIPGAVVEMDAVAVVDRD